MAPFSVRVRREDRHAALAEDRNRAGLAGRADGLVFVAGGEQGGPYSLVAYAATTGAVRCRAPWQRVVPGESGRAPTVASGFVLVGGYRGPSRPQCDDRRSGLVVPERDRLAF